MNEREFIRGGAVVTESLCRIINTQKCHVAYEGKNDGVGVKRAEAIVDQR